MKEHLLRASVRWADGTYDHKKPCELCQDENCLYPVHKDYYREVVISPAFLNWLISNTEKDESII